MAIRKRRYVCLALFSLLCALAWNMWPYRCCRHIYAASTTSTRSCDVSSNKNPIVDLDSKGYGVIQKWLSDADQKLLLDIYARIPDDPEGNGGKHVGYKTPAMHGVNLFDEVPGLFTILQKMLARIQKRTSVRVAERGEEITIQGMFLHTNSSVRDTIMFPWHQDHESQFIGNNHSRLINFYLMLEKEHPDEAGVQVVPFDSLCVVSPQLCQLARGGGAATFHDYGEKSMLAAFEETDDHFVLDFHLNDLSCTPKIHAGDLLLLRGDVIHRTQPHSSWRTSLSMRATVAPRQDRTFEGGLVKYGYMVAAPSLYIGTSQHAFLKTMLIYMGFLYRAALLPIRMLLGYLLFEEVSFANFLFGSK